MAVTLDVETGSKLAADQPGSGSLHVDGAVKSKKAPAFPGAAKPFTKQADEETEDGDGEGLDVPDLMPKQDDTKETFDSKATMMARLHSNLKAKVPAEDYAAAMRDARAHTGGKAKAAAAKAKGASDMYPDDDDAMPFLSDTLPGQWDEDMPTIPESMPHLSKGDKRVQYRAQDKLSESCAACKFVDDDSDACALVEGVIEPSGVCNLFTAMGQTFRDVMDLCAVLPDGETTKDKSTRLFVELKQYIEPPATIPYLPKPGTFTHSSYGKISITEDRLNRFVQNFRDAIYQTRVPIDLEHETKLSGAAGWITDLVRNTEGGVDAVMEWTDRGRQALEADRFAYISPEWFDSWTDPMTQRVYKDVPVGGALTTRPFFKEKALRSLVASERGLFASQSPSKRDQLTIVFQELAKTTEGADNMADKDTDTKGKEDTKVATEDKTKTAVEDGTLKMTAELDQLRAFKESVEPQLKQLKETNALLVADSRIRRFREEVRGVSEDNKTAWHGDADKNVARLSRFAEVYGEDSDEFKEFRTEQRAIAEQIRTSEILKPQGRKGSGAGADPEEKALSMARELIKEDGKLDLGAALNRVFAEHPELHDEYKAVTTIKV